MKHIHDTWAFVVKSGIMLTSVYIVYGSQNEFVESVTQVFILRMLLRMRSLGQNGPLRWSTVFAVVRIDDPSNQISIHHPTIQQTEHPSIHASIHLSLHPSIHPASQPINDQTKYPSIIPHSYINPSKHQSITHISITHQAIHPSISQTI